MAKPSDFLVNGKWACTSCGACCAYVAPLAVNNKFPKEWVNKNGACIHLKDKLCSIYENRPPICRIDKTLRYTYTDKEIAGMCAVMKTYDEQRN